MSGANKYIDKTVKAASFALAVGVSPLVNADEPALDWQPHESISDHFSVDSLRDQWHAVRSGNESFYGLFYFDPNEKSLEIRHEFGENSYISAGLKLVEFERLPENPFLRSEQDKETIYNIGLSFTF